MRHRNKSEGMSPASLESWPGRKWCVCAESQSLPHPGQHKPAVSGLLPQEVGVSSLRSPGSQQGRQKNLELCIPYAPIVTQMHHSCRRRGVGWGKRWRKSWDLTWWKEYQEWTKRVPQPSPSSKARCIFGNNYATIINNHYFLIQSLLWKQWTEQNFLVNVSFPVQ